MTQIISQLLQTATKQLSTANIDSAALDARLLLQHVLQQPHEYLITHHDQMLGDDDITAFEKLLARRLTHEPIAYLLGYQDFWKDRFLVSPDTLIPRADSETLIEGCVKLMPDRERKHQILDLGTGSGCLLLSLLREYEHAQGTGIDRSDGALSIARKNAERLDLNHRTQFLSGDMCDETTLPESPEIFDIIACNPPYICMSAIEGLQEDVKNFEPLCALDGGMQGLNFYKSVFNWLPRKTHTHSVALFEVGHDQARDVAALANQHKLNTVEIFKDIAGHQRIVAVMNAS